MITQMKMYKMKTFKMKSDKPTKIVSLLIHKLHDGNLNRFKINFIQFEEKYLFSFTKQILLCELRNNESRLLRRKMTLTFFTEHFDCFLDIDRNFDFFCNINWFFYWYLNFYNFLNFNKFLYFH